MSGPGGTDQKSNGVRKDEPRAEARDATSYSPKMDQNGAMNGPLAERSRANDSIGKNAPGQIGHLIHAGSGVLNLQRDSHDSSRRAVSV